MRAITSIIQLLGITALATVAAGLSRAAVPSEPRPAVVELFTSQGCSSCPPAEAYLGELAQRDGVLALAFHVDYWDTLGWRDRFGITDATPRQRNYARSLHLSTVYTPQVVVDGRDDHVGSDRAGIERALGTARQGIPVALAIRDGALRIAVSEAPHSGNCDVVLVAYQRAATSSIGRGENAGRTLIEHNIVRALRPLGRYSGTAQSYQAELALLPPDATDVAVLVQTEGLGPILGATQHSIR